MKTLLLSLLVVISTMGFTQDYQWVKDLSDSDPDNFLVQDIEIGPNGFVYLLANFSGTIDVAPGSTEYNITSEGDKDFFIAKYTASGQFYSVFISGNDGQYNGSNTSTDELAYDMVISSSGNIYVTGSFERDYYFAPYHQESSIECDCSGNMFVAKFNEHLTYQWVTIPHDCYEDMDMTLIEGRKIFYHSPNDEVFVAGKFTGDVSFTSSSSLYSNDSSKDVFFGKLDAADGTYSWAKEIKSSTDETETVGGIFVHPDNNYIYIAGDFYGTIDMNPSSSFVHNAVSNGSSDLFIGMYSSSGSLYTAYYGNIGSTSHDSFNAMDMDSDGNIYLSGSNYQYNTVDLDFKSGVHNTSSGAGNDAYIIKYNGYLNYQWDIPLHGSANNTIQGLGVDANNDICVYGWFYNDCDFNPNGTAYSMSAGTSSDVFYGKYSSDGEKKIFRKIGDENSSTYHYSQMFLGANKHSSDIILFGKYQTTQDFDGSEGEAFSSPISYYDGRFFAKYGDCIASSISVQPNSDATCEGNEVSLTFTALGTNLSYQWYKDLSPINDGYTIFGSVVGANTNTLTIDNVNANTDEIYKCEVSSSCDDKISTNYTSVAVDLEPSISSNPSGITSCEGNNVNFSVSAQNSTSYQWLVNDGSGFFQALSDNADYSGAQTATLTILGINPSQSYSQYKCLVGGVCEPDAYSNPATLIVNPNPNIQSNPVNTSVCESSSTSMSVSTNGNGLTYQWEYSTDGTNFSTATDGAYLSGAQSSTLTINNAPSSMNNNEFRCVVSGSCGSDVTSNAGILTVNDLAILSSHPLDVEECEYEDITYSVNASGYNLNYRWQVNEGSGWNNLNNGGSYSNVSNPSLNVSYIGTALDGNQYRCLITSGCSANIYSNTADLSVSQSPSITVTSSDGEDICEGENTLLTINGGDPDYIYQWKRNYSSIGGETDNNLSVNQSGVYSLYAENLTGCSSETDPMTINVHAMPNATITVIGNSEFCEGGYAELIVPSGNGYTYQWYNNASLVSGATSNSLITTETGNFQAVVSNTYGCENTSSSETVTVNSLPTVSLSPTNVEICQGETGTITATDNSNYIYQWKQNNLNISGENSNTINVSENGMYNVAVMNSTTGCSYTSTYISATVNALPTPEIQTSGILIYCVTDQVDLTLSETYSQYLWSNSSMGSSLTVDQNGTYYVTVTDANGCESTDEFEVVEELVSTPNICMVSVDTVINKNLIVWEHEEGAVGIESYNIYKLDNSIYQLLGNILYNDTTEFVDLTSEPGIHSDRYAIASVDACGNIGAYSPYHQTMNLSIVDGSGDAISLIWTKYIDEAGLNNPTEYEIYRGTGSLSYFSSITGGLSDYNYNIPTTLNDERFIIIVQRPVGCAPLNDGTKASGGPYYQSSSNIEDEGIIATGIKAITSEQLEIYPNPMQTQTVIKSDVKLEQIKLYTITGELVRSISDLNTNEYKLLKDDLSVGTYVIEINNTIHQKLIVE